MKRSSVMLAAFAAGCLVLVACATPSSDDATGGSLPVPPPATSAGVPIRALPVEGSSSTRIVDVDDGVAVGWAEFPDTTGVVVRQAIAISIEDAALHDLGTADVGRSGADRIAGTMVTGSLVREDGKLGLFLVDLASGWQGRPSLGEEPLAPPSFDGVATGLVTSGVFGDELIFSATGRPGESWRSLAAGLTEMTVRDLGVSGGDNLALIAVSDGRAVGWSGAADAFHPVVLDLSTGAFTDVPLEPGDDLGMLVDADDGWAAGWSHRRDGGGDTSIAWNLATGERRVIGKGLIAATGGGWVVGAAPDGTMSATRIVSGRIVDLGRLPMETNLEIMAFDGRWLVGNLAGPGRGTVPVALDLEAALR